MYFTQYVYYYKHFTALWILLRTTQVSWYQKIKTSLDLLVQEIVSGSGISWAICKSAPCPRQMTMPASLHKMFTPIYFFFILECCKTSMFCCRKKAYLLCQYLLAVL